MIKRSTLHLCATSVLAMGVATPALAQDSAEGASGADIIVTARRVEERLQDVPISITVFNQEQLTKQNVVSAKDLATYTPSLSTNQRYGSDYASFSIRGFTQEARTTASVGVYFADVVTPRAGPMSQSGDGAGPGSMFDLQNVQVLKGPQGTLFGRNTTGGAIVLVPKRPTDNFEGYVEGSYGNYDMRRIQGVINLPATENFRVRAGIDWQKRDGWQENYSPVGPRDFASIDYVAARLSALWDVAPDIENYTIVSYVQSQPTGPLPKLTDCNYSAAQGVNSGPYALPCQQIQRERSLDTSDRATWLPFGGFQKSQTWQVINHTKWQVNDNLTVKNIASYGKLVQDQAMDLYGIYYPLGATITLPTATAPYFRTVNVPAQYQGKSFGSSTVISPLGLHASNQETFTEELQFQGKNGELDWQAGAYFERSIPKGYTGTQSVEGVLCDSEAQWANFACTDVIAALGESGGRAVNYQVGKVNYRNVGLYAQATYKFSPQFSIDAGFRYTWDKSWGSGRVVSVNYPSAPFNVPQFSCTMPQVAANYTNRSVFTPELCTVNYSKTSKAPTWMVGLNFKPIDDILLYAKYSRGYRQGSVNPTAAYGFNTYDPERVDVYEAGVKASFDGAVRGTFNISGFYNDFTDMQLQVSFLDLQPNATLPRLSPGPAIINAGKSRILGFEVESTLEPVEGLSLQASFSYLDTKLTRFTRPDLSAQINDGYDDLSSTPLVGSRLGYTPKYKLVLGANYRLPLDETVGKVSVGASFIRTGSVYYMEDSSVVRRVDSIFAAGDPQRTFPTAPAYNLVNLNLNWANIAQSNLSASFFMTNVFDKVYYDARSPGSRNYVTRYQGEPRMFGGRLRYDF